MPRSSENIQSESQYISNCQLKRDCQLHWYAVRVTYSRELSLKDYLDKADIDTTYCRFILEIHEMNIRKRTAKLVAKNFSSNRYSTVYVRAFFKKKRSKWRLKSVYMDFVKR